MQKKSIAFIKNLKLQNFRNYTEATVSFCPGINIIYGHNGQGKSNLLEAVHMISTGRSFRTRQYADLLRNGESNPLVLEAEIVKEGIVETISVQYTKEKREVRTNQGRSSYLSSLLGTLPIIFLTANDPSFISGSPADRRRFVDLHLAQVDSVYLHYLGRYYKALKQKNALLRAHNVAMLGPWETIMVQSAHYIIQKRCALLSKLNQTACEWTDVLSMHKEDVRFSYLCSLSTVQQEKELLLFVQEQREKERKRGITLYGPHRDDIHIEIAGKLARTFASEGQKRTCGTALRFAEWQAMKERLHHLPLLAMDDFGAQLDSDRRDQLQTQLQAFGQVFLTISDPDPKLLSIPGAKRFHIDAGVITEDV